MNIPTTSSLFDARADDAPRSMLDPALLIRDASIGEERTLELLHELQTELVALGAKLDALVERLDRVTA